MAEKKEKKTTSKSAEKKTVKKTVKKVKEAKPKKEKEIRTKKIVRATSKEITLVEHELIPKHEKITDKEAQALFEFHNITIKELPKIIKNDPAIRHLNAKENDIIKITRASPTAGISVFYRGVINE
jgi:DNA-directed RNA polymerase subunit H